MRRAADETIAVAEIGGTSVKIGFVHLGHPSGFTRTWPTTGLRQGATVAHLAALLRSTADEAGLKPDRVVATVPGFIGRDFDTVLHAANVPELEGIKLASELTAELGLPVRLERDVVLQLLGESVAGAVKGESEVLAVYLGTGIGAAYLGKAGIFRGGGWALEIGHMPVYRSRLTDAPQRIEAYASGATLADLAARHGIAVADLFQASAGVMQLAEALDDILWHQAVTIASAATLFSPRIILLGGGVIEMSGYPRALLKQRIARCLPCSERMPALDIRWASLGWQAAIHGAVLAGHDEDPH
ncbi:ROK family protein [Taklimakanibacter lacteus]|uniref:ROK family protein n=1 Tax=Taklimakanibacter lacteus TaxID=2268456 RepID=UPI000E673B4C